MDAKTDEFLDWLTDGGRFRFACTPPGSAARTRSDPVLTLDGETLTAELMRHSVYEWLRSKGRTATNTLIAEVACDAFVRAMDAH